MISSVGLDLEDVVGRADLLDPGDYSNWILALEKRLTPLATGRRARKKGVREADVIDAGGYLPLSEASPDGLPMMDALQGAREADCRPGASLSLAEAEWDPLQGLGDGHPVATDLVFTGWDAGVVRRGSVCPAAT